MVYFFYIHIKFWSEWKWSFVSELTLSVTIMHWPKILATINGMLGHFFFETATYIKNVITKMGFIRKKFGIITQFIRGHSKTTWTRFWPFLTTYLPTYLNVDIFYPKRGQKEAFFDHLPTSPCPRSLWTTPYISFF